jgi:hypothetical protein
MTFIKLSFGIHSYFSRNFSLILNYFQKQFQDTLIMIFKHNLHITVLFTWYLLKNKNIYINIMKTLYVT